jgi:superfamily II DNA helicase RecQ
MILSCIARLHGEGDYSLVAKILRGQAPNDYMRLTTYGILTTLSEEVIVAQCHALELDGYILNMTLLSKGYDLALERIPPQPIALPRLSTPRHLKPQAATRAPSFPQEGLAAALRKWAKEEGERRSLPAYCILNSKTIGEIAKRRPTTEAELQLISGIGDKKRVKYGEAILALVQSYGVI